MLDFFEQMFSGGSQPFVLTIATGVVNPHLRNLALSAGWDGQAPVEILLSGGLVNTLDIPAAWDFPGGLSLTIAAGTRVGGVRNGGFALRTRQPITVNNLGILSGGGGYGGAGQSILGDYKGTAFGPAAGGSPGQGAGFLNASTLTLAANENGQAGQAITYTGPVFGGDSPPYIVGGYGGPGGYWGMAGGTGSAGSGGSPYSGPFAGSSGGLSVDGNAYITWVATGTREGGVA